MSGQRGGSWRGLTLIGSGMMLGATIVGGYWLGSVADVHYGSGARWTTIGLLLGLTVGLVDLVRVAIRLMRAEPPIVAKRDIEEEDAEDDGD